jgi:hypothetical protein
MRCRNWLDQKRVVILIPQSREKNLMSLFFGTLAKGKIGDVSPRDAGST